jgi:HEAT repeat protein
MGETAANGDPQLRQMAVYALGFFSGPTATQLLRDRIRSDEDRFTRYNAAVALGRRGDAAAEATLREMFSTADLDKVIEIESATEKQNKIEAIQLEALEALRTSLRNGSPQLARSLRPEVEKLTKSGLVRVRSQALEILQSLQAKP